ncbi:hypothetical protein M3Y98_00916000 [Aphelenchoides besseyi]|nr:hypothetical protein M3Y98_00916000 [Aphelenchoides besseyi]
MAEYEPLGPIINSDPDPRQFPAAKHQNATVNPNPQDFFSVPPNGLGPSIPPSMPAPSVPNPTVSVRFYCLRFVPEIFRTKMEKRCKKSIRIKSRAIRNADFGGGQSSYLPIAERKMEAEPDVEIKTRRAKKSTKQIVGMSIFAFLFVGFVIVAALSLTAIILKWHE